MVLLVLTGEHLTPNSRVKFYAGRRTRAMEMGNSPNPVKMLMPSCGNLDHWFWGSFSISQEGENKLENKICSFLFRKKEIFYFIRRVPVGLQDRYQTKRISFSLKTKSEKVALARSKELAARLEDLWFNILLQEEAVFGRFLKKPDVTPQTGYTVKLPQAMRQFLTRCLFLVRDLKHPTMQYC